MPARKRSSTATLERPEAPLPVEDRPVVVEARRRVEQAIQARDSVSSDAPIERYQEAAERVTVASLAYDEAVKEAEAEVKVERLDAQLQHALEMLARLEISPNVNPADLEGPRRDVARWRQELEEARGVPVELAVRRREAEERAARRATMGAQHEMNTRAGVRTARNSSGGYSDLRAGPEQPGYEGDDYGRDHPAAGAMPEQLDSIEVYDDVVMLLNQVQPRQHQERRDIATGSAYVQEVRPLGELLQGYARAGGTEAERLNVALRQLDGTRDTARLRYALVMYRVFRQSYGPEADGVEWDRLADSVRG